VIRLLIRARYATLALAVVALIGLALFGRPVGYDQSIESFFAQDDPNVVAYRRASAAFGNDQIVFLAYDDPELLTEAGLGRVRTLAEAIGPAQIDGVVRVESLDAMPPFWLIDDRLVELERGGVFGALRGALRAAGRGELATDLLGAARQAGTEGLADLRAKITAHPLLKGTLVAESGTTTALVVRLKAAGEHDAKLTVGALRRIADRFAVDHGFARPFVVGPPVLLADGFTAIEVDGRRLAVVGMFLIGLVTLTATRSLWWATVPIVAGWTVWLATSTILATLGLRLSLSSGPLVAQIIVLTMPAASHLALHFRDDLRARGDRRASAVATLASVAAPIAWCTLATTIGYGALLTSNVVPIRQFGAVLAVCTAAAALLTTALAPSAMLPPLRIGTRLPPGRPGLAARGVGRLTTWVVDHPALVVVGALAVAAPLVAGMLRLRYESNYINAFQPTTRVVSDYRAVEARLGGIGLVELVVPAPATLDAKTLARFAALDRGLAGLKSPDGRSAVTQSVSLATVLDPDGRIAQLPDRNRDRALKRKLDLIATTPQAALLDGFWNRELGRSRVLVRVSESQPAAAKEAAFASMEALAQVEFGPSAELTGLSHLLTQTTRGIVSTQWTTFSWAAGGIFVALMLAFRGPKLAALALLPTLLAVGFVLGLMGWLDLPLDVATALVASVALGLSVDDTFHCLLQFRRLRASEPFREALFASYAVSGPGVLLSSLAVAVGFAVLRFSEFVPFATFGTMVAIATAGSTLGNLALLPACLALAERLKRPTPSASPATTAGTAVGAR